MQRRKWEKIIIMFDQDLKIKIIWAREQDGRERNSEDSTDGQVRG